MKVLLENYSYQVIDLGRDVPPEKVVAAVLEEDVRLVGLGALMTTTVPSMEETIRQLRSVFARHAGDGGRSRADCGLRENHRRRRLLPGRHGLGELCGERVCGVKEGGRGPLPCNGNVRRRKAMKKLILGLAILCTLLTFAGAGYVLIQRGAVNAGYAVIPMLFALCFTQTYRRMKSDEHE